MRFFTLWRAAAPYRGASHPLLQYDLSSYASIVTEERRLKLDKALWLPLLITVASAVAAITVGGTNVISAFLFAYFVQTPAIGGVFIAGFLAPRASWLLGVIIGSVAAIGYSIYIAIAASRVSGVGGPPPSVIQETILSALILSPILGGFFASGAAWYRRFLALSSPNRGRQSQAAKQAAKRGDGRTRGSQKAGVRR